MLGRQDNHDTTGTSMLRRIEIKICKIEADLKSDRACSRLAALFISCSFEQQKVWWSTVILDCCYFPGNICLEDVTERRNL